MALYRYSTLINDQALVFTPSLDLLYFNTQLSASALELTNDGFDLAMSLGGKHFTLLDTQPWQLSALNFKFANGSKIISSGPTNNFSHDLVGSLGGDLLVGSAPVTSITLGSTRTDGNQGNDFSSEPSLSADGRFVAFSSAANNLVTGDTNNAVDIFVKDLQTGVIQRASTNNIGNQSDSSADAPSLSADGRFVAFYSFSNKLVAGDTNNAVDIFVKDLQTGAIKLASAANDGNPGNLNSFNPSLSADGLLVTFESDAINLVTGDNNGLRDIFVKNLQTGVIQLASADSVGNEANGFCNRPSLSKDGRFVTFNSDASNLVTGDTNGFQDIFVKNLQTGVIQRGSTDSAGNQANFGCFGPRLSADGRYVVFDSLASNLVTGDTNGTYDVFFKDLQTGAIQRISTDSLGNQGNGNSDSASLSADGRFVIFESNSSNLILGDTNGAVDIFVKDLQTGAIRLISMDSIGNLGNSISFLPTLSADSGQIAFLSSASNLVANDTNGTQDIFTVSNPFQSLKLAGGDGNDSYLIQNPNDNVVEALNQGTDTVRSSISFTLPDNVENLLLLGDGNSNATGNALNNSLTGNVGNNIFTGGLGTDTVSYATASDAVTVDLSITTNQDTGSAGIDRLISGIENLVGSNFADALFGNATANVLTGGLGADIMVGDLGNDTYDVDNVGDQVVELLGGGTDTVRSTISFVLGDQLEILNLLGTIAINGTGNALNNTLFSNSGNNVLDGGAGIDTMAYNNARAGVKANIGIATIQSTGSGADTLKNFENLTGSNFDDTLTGNSQANVLRGLLGIDKFVFNNSSAVDTVADFITGQDKLAFSKSGLPIGDGDTVLEGAITAAGPGGFVTTAELVIVTSNIIGAVNATSAAAVIGGATSAYGVGSKVLFAVDNGADTGVFLFNSAAADAVVSSTELTQLVSLTGVASTSVGDYLFDV